MIFGMILIFVPFLWVEGLTLFPFVLLKHKNPPDWLINHERIHLRQQLEMGIVLFYVWYFVEYLVGRCQNRKHYSAYRAISFEREAYKHDANLDYLTTRKPWAFLKFIRK
jgi:hypothetical protein